MKKKSGNFFDKMSGQLVKNCFLSIYRHFPLWERKNSGNSSKDFPLELADEWAMMPGNKWSGSMDMDLPPEKSYPTRLCPDYFQQPIQTIQFNQELPPRRSGRVFSKILDGYPGPIRA